jgi:MYXO-CTERM domain-containing protein
MPAMSERERDTQKPHDVLAAEEFGIGTRDERVPPDPTGIHGPHDVLAAEEFAIPSPGDHAQGAAGGSGVPSWVPLAVLGIGALVLLRRRRS